MLALPSGDAHQPGRPGVWFHQPNGAVGIVVFQLPVFVRAQVQCPDNRGAVDIGGIMHPLAKHVLRAVTNEYQLLAESLR